MRKFDKPEIELIDIERDDVIATSGTGPSEKCEIADLLNGTCE